MSINIQTADGLKEVGKVTKKKILKALGFTPADVQDLFSGDFNDLENNPIMASDEDTEFAIVDKNGNIILKVDADGVHTPDVYLKDVGKISEALRTKELPSIEDDEGAVLYVIDINGNIVAKIDEYGFHSIALSYRDESEDIDVKAKFAETQENIDSHVDNTEVHVTPEDKTKWNNKSEFDGNYDSLMNPPELPDISNDETNTLYVVDNNGNIIASIDNSGFHTTDIYLENLGNIRGFIGNASYNNGTEGLAYRELDDGTMACTGIGTAGTATNIQIASIINGKPVTSIIGSAFYNCDFTHVVIPDSVTSIGIQAFQFCGKLTSVVIGDGVTSIGGSAFHSCIELNNVVMGRGVTSIGSAAFGNCKKLIDVVIPNGVKSLGPATFSGCSSLMSVVIPDSVTSIGYSAFENCSGLKSVVIPDSVISIGYNAFKNCTNLTSIVIPDSVTSIDGGSLSYGILNGCSALESITIPFVGNRADATSEDTNQYPFGYIFGTGSYTGGTATEQHYYGSSTSSTTSSTYYIPTSLKKVTVTGGNILRGAFYNCSSLTSIEIPNGVTEIGEWAFAYCGLTSIKIPYGVISIGTSAFIYCIYLINVVIPDSVTSIGKDAFLHCEKLTSVAIPDSVTSIGTRAFEYCKSLTSVAIPDSVTSIGYGAFNGCSALESITIPFVGAMEDDTNYTHFGSIFGAASYNLHVDYVPTSLKEVVITGGTSIAGNAFHNCKSLRAIYIANSITSIGQSAFNQCTALNNVRLGDSITSIGAYAFNTCVNLKVISIPYSITTIESSIFLNSAVKIIKYDGPVSGFQSLLTKNSAILNGATSDAFVYCLDGKIAQDGTVTEY